MRLQKRMMALALAACMTLLAACSGGQAPEGGSQPGTAAAMGRYVEEEMTLPEGVGYIEGIHRTPEGALELFCNLDPDKALGPWYLFTSDDGGARWVQKEAPWLDTLAGPDQVMGVQFANWDREGTLYLYYNLVDRAVMEALLAGDKSAADNYNPTYSFVKISPDGIVSEMPFEPAHAESGADAIELQVAENGDILFNCYFDLVQVDGATGEVKNTYTPDSFGGSLMFTTYGETLVLSDGPDLKLYNLGTGELSETISDDRAIGSGAPSRVVYDGSRGAQRALAMDPSGAALCSADQTGLYRRLVDGAVTEKLLDGELCSLNMPSITLTDLIPMEDGSFLVLCAGEEKSLLRYSFSADTPTLPSTELRVFSLEDNKNIRQAMALYQRQNPDVQVVYNVALSGGDAVTAADALRTLSTELLAGKGPDLLVLDGMPIDSYVEKGVLLDLTGLAEGKLSAGEWLRPQTESFQSADGKIYAVPARFSVPSMTVEKAAAGLDFSAFCDWLVQQENAAPTELSGHMGMLDSLYYKALIEQFYPVCAPAWFMEDGSVDREAFSEFLTGIKKLSDLAGEERRESDAAAYESGYDPFDTFSVISWLYGANAAALCELQSVRDISYFDAAISEAAGRGITPPHGVDNSEKLSAKISAEGALVPLAGQARGVFVPKTVLGVNAQSANTDRALQFLELCLSESVQKNDFDDGMPVNAAAFAAAQINPYAEGDDGMYMSSSYHDEQGGDIIAMELQVIWPSKAFMDEAAGWITALDRPYAPNEVVKQMVLEETGGYFDGTRTLEETVSAFGQKLDLYLSE